MTEDIRAIIKQGLQDNRQHNRDEKAEGERERANEYPMGQPEDLADIGERAHLNNLLRDDNVQTIKTFSDRLREAFNEAGVTDEDGESVADNSRRYVALLHVSPEAYMWKMATSVMPNMNWRSFKSIRHFDRIAIVPFDNSVVSGRSWVEHIVDMSRIVHPSYGTFVIFDDNGTSDFKTQDEAVGLLRKVLSIYYKIPRGRILHRLPLYKSRWGNWGFQAKDDQNRALFASGFRWATKDEAQTAMREWGNKYKELMA